MLNEMRSAAQTCRFISSTDADPHPDGDAFHVRHLGGRDTHAVVKLGDLEHVFPIRILPQCARRSNTCVHIRNLRHCATIMPRDRTELEKQEYKLLAPYAQKSA